MPKVVVARSHGGPEAIEVVEIPTRAPGAGEARIAVRAAALNPVDAKRAAGSRGADPAALPLRLGFEAAGTIVALGSEGLVGGDGTGLAVGQEVVVFRVPGAQADELVVPAADVLQRPAALPAEAAAGLLLVGTTAAQAVDVVRPGPGEIVLVHAAAGSVGRAAAQLALRRGARVVGTASPGRHAELRALGVEPVCYGPGLLDRVRALGPVDAAIDAIGDEAAVEVSLAIVADRARIVTVAHAAGIIAAGGVEIGSALPGTDALRDGYRAELLRLAGAGGLEIPVVASFPLAAAREAYALLVEGHAGGKIVLVP